MIRRVRLERWKAFPSLDVSLSEGTSFIVAANGVGKTSLLQALHFGLYGDRRLLGSGSPVEQAVRGDGGTARVTLDVDLGGDAWNIVRTVPKDQGPRDPLPQALVSRNGAPSTEAAWNAAFADAAGVALDELRLLSAIGEGDALQPVASGQYDLVEHLSDVLGVTRMRSSAKQLRAHARAISRAADDERLVQRDRPQRLLEQEHENLIRQQGRLQERLQAARERYEELRANLATVQRWNDWQTQRLQREQQRSRLQARFAEVLERWSPGVPGVAAAPATEPGDLRLLVQTAVQACRNTTQQLAERVGASKASAVASQRSLDELQRGEARCPTCLRPMTPEESGEAAERHRAQLQQALAEQRGVEADLASIRIVDAALVEIIRDLDSMRDLEPPGDEPPEGVEVADLMADVDAARSAMDSADEAARDVAAQLRMHTTAVAADEASEALSRRLTQRYREADLAVLAAETIDALAERICAEQITPLAQVLAKRWIDLWPGRPTVGLDVTTGKLFAEYDSTRLDVSALSGGERTVASVLLRLLALQAASRSPILLLDEPLEHLDPRNRRMLAGVLVAAGKSVASPRQILVTTYEESVTRRLSDATGSPSHVLHIRPGPPV